MQNRTVLFPTPSCSIESLLEAGLPSPSRHRHTRNPDLNEFLGRLIQSRRESQQISSPASAGSEKWGRFPLAPNALLPMRAAIPGARQAAARGRRGTERKTGAPLPYLQPTNMKTGRLRSPVDFAGRSKQQAARALGPSSLCSSAVERHTRLHAPGVTCRRVVERVYRHREKTNASAERARLPFALGGWGELILARFLAGSGYFSNQISWIAPTMNGLLWRRMKGRRNPPPPPESQCR